MQSTLVDEFSRGLPQVFIKFWPVHEENITLFDGFSLESFLEDTSQKLFFSIGIDSRSNTVWKMDLIVSSKWVLFQKRYVHRFKHGCVCNFNALASVIIL